MHLAYYKIFLSNRKESTEFYILSPHRARFIKLRQVEIHLKSQAKPRLMLLQQPSRQALKQTLLTQL